MKKRRKLFVIFSYISVTAALCIFMYLILVYPQHAGEGVKKGINLCLYTLMPSMYPFMILSSFIISSSLAEKSELVFSLVTKKILNLPGICGVIIILSMIGGLPVGAKAVEDAYDRGCISRAVGQRLLTFCINPGPAFVITSVGFYFLNSRLAGVIIYISLVLSSLTIGFLTRFIFQSDGGYIYNKKEKAAQITPFSVSLVNSVGAAIRSIINVSAWVILFSCIIELIGLFPLSDGTELFISGITEMTNGVKAASGKVPMPIIAGIIGFTGICGQMQIMPTVIKLKMPLKYFLAARVINAALATVVSMLLLDVFSVSVETVTMGHLPETLSSDFSFPVCIGVLIMSVLLLLGDNFYVKKGSRLHRKKTL